MECHIPELPATCWSGSRQFAGARTACGRSLKLVRGRRDADRKRLAGICKARRGGADADHDRPDRLDRPAAWHQARHHETASPGTAAQASAVIRRDRPQAQRHPLLLSGGRALDGTQSGGDHPAQAGDRPCHPGQPLPVPLRLLGRIPALRAGAFRNVFGTGPAGAATPRPRPCRQAGWSGVSDRTGSRVPRPSPAVTRNNSATIRR